MHKIILTQTLRCSLAPFLKQVKTSFVFKLYGNTFAINDRISGVLPPSVAKLSWAIPTPLKKLKEIESLLSETFKTMLTSVNNF